MPTEICLLGFLQLTVDCGEITCDCCTPQCTRAPTSDPSFPVPSWLLAFTVGRQSDLAPGRSIRYAAGKVNAGSNHYSPSYSVAWSHGRQETQCCGSTPASTLRPTRAAWRSQQGDLKPPLRYLRRLSQRRLTQTLSFPPFQGQRETHIRH
jgi:hypothetical protein